MTTFRIRQAIGEIVGGLILLVIGVVWAIEAENYDLLGEGGRLAPGTVPFVCGTALAITGAYIAIKALLSSRHNEGELLSQTESERAASTGSGAGITAPAPAGANGATLTDSKPSLGARVRLMPTAYPVLTVFLLLTAGLLMMPLLGFSISFALLILAILRYVERQRIRTSLLVGVITALFGFILFEVLFNLPLPEPFFL